MSDGIVIERHAIRAILLTPDAHLRNAVERLTPLSLAEIVAQYITYGPPPEPLPVDGDRVDCGGKREKVSDGIERETREGIAGGSGPADTAGRVSGGVGGGR